MRSIAKIGAYSYVLFAAAFCLVALGLYHLSIYIMPSVTVKNESGYVIKQAYVYLPDSRLDFGKIGGAIPETNVESTTNSNTKNNTDTYTNSESNTNTLHYSLSQPDGSYRYYFQLSNNKVLEGSCGYVTQNQITKRTHLTIKESTVNCLEN